MDAWTQKPLALFIANRCHVNYEGYTEETKRAIREIGVRNMMISQRLSLVLQKLKEKDIPVIMLKGCHLIQEIYPFGIRPIEDIDLLLDRKHFEVVDEILRTMGYEDTAFAMDVWTHLQVANKMTYMDQTNPAIPIDVHFTLGPYPYLGRISFENLLENSQRLTLNGIECLVLQPEMLLVHLGLHLFQHHQEQWTVSAYDLSALTTLRQQAFDWKRFVSLVKEYSLSLPIQHSIKMTRSIAEVHMPAAISKEIASISLTWKERWVFRACLVMTKGLEKHVIQFVTLPGFWLKLKCLLRMIFPTRAVVRHYYNGSYPRYLYHGCLTVIRMLLRG